MDYVPNKRDGRYRWYKNLSDNAVTEAAKFSGADADAVKSLADDIIGKMEATDAAQTATDGARAIENPSETTNLPQIRSKIRNWKTMPDFPASGSESVLKLKGTEPAFDPATYKPVIKLSMDAGKIKVDFTKRGVDGIAVYCRLRGTTAWRKIGTDTDSPYYDTGPLAQAGVPEVREYMARGMIGDEEIGQDSDIGSITFAG